MRYIVALALAFGVAPFANAQPTEGYYGLSLGTLDYKEDDGFGTNLISDSASTWRLIAGYEFNDYFAVEGGYGKSGRVRGSFDDPSFGQIDISLEFQFLNVRAVGMLPFKTITLYGALGYSDTKQKFSESVPGFSISGSQTDSTANYALGIQFDVGDRIGIRAEYEKFDVDSSVDMSNANLTFLLKF